MLAARLAVSLSVIYLLGGCGLGTDRCILDTQETLSHSGSKQAGCRYGPVGSTFV